MSRIAQRVGCFDSSDFREAIKKQRLLKNPVDLSIGIPEDHTPLHIKYAGVCAILGNKTRYTPANGLPELREALARKLKTENNVLVEASAVTVVPGLTTGQLLVYLAVLDPGDEVIVFDPYYPPYPHLATMVGAKVVFAPTTADFQPDLPALKARITKKTKLIVVNTPNNPSGAVYPKQTLLAIAEIAKQNDILLISDEIYEHFVYKGKHFSIGSAYQNTITMNGFSKEHAMTGWRLGYIAGPQDIINAINELQQYVVMSSSSISQYAALAALKKARRPEVLKKYKAKHALVVSRLSKLGYEVGGADGAFYAFVKAPKNMSDVEFVDKATEHGLIVVAGRAFSQQHGYIRIAYGAGIKTLHRGLDILEKIAAELR